MKRIQLSLMQVLLLIAALIISTGHFLFVRIVLLYSGRDGVLVIVPSIAVGILVFYSIVRISKLHPGKTVIEANLDTCGRWFGRLVSLPYLLFFMAIPALVIRALGDFLPMTMPYTPYGVIISLITLLACLAVRQGIEVVCRCALILMPILILLGLSAALLTMKDKHYEYVLPMLQTSWPGYMRGTVMLSASFCEVVVAGMFVGFVQPQKKLQTKNLVLFFVIIGLMFIGPMTGPVALFDIESSSKFAYPTYEEIRYIEVADFLERLDVVGILLWACGAFLKISCFLYALTMGTAQWFGLEDHRPFIFPFAVVLLIQATYFVSNRTEMWVYLMKDYPLFMLVIGLLLPWITLFVGRLRKKPASAT